MGIYLPGLLKVIFWDHVHLILYYLSLFGRIESTIVKVCPWY